MASPSIVLVGALFAEVAQTARAATAWVRGDSIKRAPGDADGWYSQRFAPPSTSPTEQSANYTGFSNDTINDVDVVEGKVHLVLFAMLV